MKFLNNFSLWKRVMPVVALIAVAAPVFGQTNDRLRTELLTGLPATVDPSTTSTAVTNAVFRIQRDLGVAILPIFSLTTNSVGANITFTFEVSTDNLTYSNNGPLTMVVAHNNTNVVRAYKNFAPADLNNVAYMKLVSIQNAATNTLNLTSVRWSYFRN